MTTWLRWIPGALALERRLDEVSLSREALQAEVRALRGEIERLREDTRAAQEAERTAYQMLVNVDFQLKYGFAPFPGSPKLPDMKVPRDDGAVLDAGYVNMRRVVESEAQKEREKLAQELGLM